jgi:dipeptidyl aminopeptidase/acylaminoacyl peptidase
MNIQRYGTLLILLAVPQAASPLQQRSAPPAFTVDQILGFPSPENLVASPVGSTIAWTFNERGVRNIYVADAPGFEPRLITPYREDDGQELTQLSFSTDGTTIVYVRGGDHGSNRQADAPPNPAENPVQPKIQIWSIPVAGGAPTLIGDGDDPAIAPDNERVAFVKNRQIWLAPLDGSKQPQQAFYARGTSQSPVWSPDGRTLAFVSSRNDHSFIGLFTADQPIRFIAPTTSRDSLPAWSSDGKKIAFLRQPGAGGAPRPPLARPEPQPWSILVANVESASLNAVPPVTAVTSGHTGPPAWQPRRGPRTPVDPILQNPGGIGLRWAADDTLVYLSYRDGFPHLYSIQHPGPNGKPTLLTPGSFMVEQVTLTPDRRFAIYNANAGSDSGDIDRRHLFKVPVNAAAPSGSQASLASVTSLTSGNGIEWNPVVTADNQMVAFLKSDAQRPPAPAIIPVSGGTVRAIGEKLLPAEFPVAQLVVPKLVAFRASDGVEAHGQLFEPAADEARKPAIVYIHGGGPRQMLLGWHYRWEYANDYGANQYLASRGFIVLSVDYRLSVGYGQAFQFADNTGARGAAEYRDILAGGRYLQARAGVDPGRIGVWGASLGGYLTALALGRNSDVFAAGVDIHGVHDRVPAINALQQARAIAGDSITEVDLRQALKVAYESSPIAAVSTWKSPVLLIHGDDDRTVDFHQTVDLERRLLAKGVKAESLVLPDDVHDSLLWRNWRTEISAMAQFFERTLQTKQVRN